jgi:hypothetical protein
LIQEQVRNDAVQCRVMLGGGGKRDAGYNHSHQVLLC